MSKTMTLSNGKKGKERLSAHTYLTMDTYHAMRESKHLTKDDIECLAKDIVLWARENKLGKDYSLLYNGKCLHYEYDWKTNRRHKKVDENKDPHKWCEYFSENFILGIACDGMIYRCLNEYEYCRAKEKLDGLLHTYGLYLSCCDYPYWEAELLDGWTADYTVWKKEKIVWLYNYHDAIDYGIPEIASVMELWYQLAKETDDKGCCTIGEYMEFFYKGIRYRMAAQSPYQGDYSWSKHVPIIKEKLKEISATEVYMNYGRMD